MNIKLTNYSIAGGCGCKVPNNILNNIIKDIKHSEDRNILTDFRHNEDSAIMKISDTQCLVYSLDFFTPIVDDPEAFGRIAAANAISDVFAEGAKPFMALSILGFPKEIENTDVPHLITKGSSTLCQELGISLAGGHTIYNPQVFYGLSVIGMADVCHLKLNSAARVGDLIYLTKPIGSGVLSTAMRRGALSPEDMEAMVGYLSAPNRLGALLGEQSFVHCMTDITGFGLLGHLAEVCNASEVSADLHFGKIKIMPNLDSYIRMGIITNGGQNNRTNYQHHVNGIADEPVIILADPQSNGGLLITVNPKFRKDFEAIMHTNGLGEFAEPIGEITTKRDLTVNVVV